MKSTTLNELFWERDAFVFDIVVAGEKQLVVHLEIFLEHSNTAIFTCGVELERIH
jgi:hypothetical protein